MTWKFDPQQTLTNEEITQILRSLFSDIPDRQKAYFDRDVPAKAKYVVEKPADGEIIEAENTK